MRRYIADQERSSMPRPPTRSSPRYRDDHNPFISRSNEINVTYWLMSLTAIFTGLNLFSVEIGKYLLLNTNNLFSSILYIPSLFTSMFTINGDAFNILISLLFAEFMLYSFGKTIEIQFGPKFIKTLYFTAGCIAVSIVIIIQILGPILIQTNGLVPSYVSIQWCTILTILTFLLYIIGLEREIRTFLFFIPMRIKPKYLLGFLIIYASIFAIMGIFDSGIPTELYLAELVCIYLGKVFYQKYGKTMLNQFF